MLIDILITLTVIFSIGCGMLGAWLIAGCFEERRTRACKKTAKELELKFKTVDDEAIGAETSAFQLMLKGHSRKHRNVMSAVTDDVTIRIFDYQYRINIGQDESKYQQTVATIHSSSMRLPTFQADPEGMVHQISSLLGNQDIDFRNHRQFSRAFTLQSTMESETRAFFDDTLLDYFASCPKLHFEASGSSFLFYDDKHTVKPKNLRHMLKEAYQVFNLLRDRSAYLETHELMPANEPPSECVLVG